MTVLPLSKKERTRRALLHKKVDRLPSQINYTDAYGQILSSHFNAPLAELPLLLGNHLLRVDISHKERLSDDGRMRYDWWGVGFDSWEEGYFAAVNPLADITDLDSYPWPDPHEPMLMREAQATIQENGANFFTVPNLGFALFERAWSLRGFEQFFLDMATDPAYAGHLLDRITDIQETLIQRYLELGIDGGYFGDDYGAQKNLLFSPKLWRKLIKPRLARLFAPFKERGLPIIMHSDGQIQQILPDMVEIGLTTINPVQPEVLDHTWLQKEFSGRLSFYGGLSTQTVLPNGTQAEVETAVAQVLVDLAPDGTGLLLAPSHRLMSDIPLNNFLAMFRAFTRLG